MLRARHKLLFPGLLGNKNSLDPDAAAYIAAIEGDGETVTTDQRSALNAFFTTGKTEGWYSSLKRLYLPIWGAASPNARCLVSGTSGTFNGAVTHGAGYVAGNGSTGYLDTGWKPASDGELSNSSAWMGALWYDLFGNMQNGVYQASTESMLLVHLVAPSVRNELFGSGGRDDTAVGSAADIEGVFSANHRSNTTRHRVLQSAGLSVDADIARSSTGTVPDANIYWLGRHRSDTAGFDQASTTKFGAMWMGSGVADDLDESFCAALRTLWETCTGLSLP